MNREERTRLRRQRGEELWKQKFADFGLSEHFDFVSRDWTYYRGQRATVTCKSCGASFQTTNLDSIFKRKLKRLTCPECGMKSDGDVQWTKSAVCNSKKGDQYAAS